MLRTKSWTLGLLLMTFTGPVAHAQMSWTTLKASARHPLWLLTPYGILRSWAI